MTVADVISLIDRYFPLSKALAWDNSGLQIGSLNRKVKRALISLDIDIQIAREASTFSADLVITHHPLIMEGIKRIDTENRQGKLISYLVKKDINVVSFHTNVDVASGGLADYVGNIIGLTEMIPLTEEGIGRIGMLSDPVTLNRFIKFIKKRLNIQKGHCIKVVPGKNRIHKVAICPGSGGDLIDTAIEKGADCYITGDVKYHQAQKAKGKLSVIDAGHFYTEYPFCQIIHSILSRETRLDIKISEKQKDLFQYI